MKNTITIQISSGSIAKTLIFIALAALMFWMRDILIVVLTSIVIASAMNPFIELFMKPRLFGISLNRVFAVIAVYGVVASLAVSLTYYFLPRLLTDTSTFLATAPTYIDNLELWNPAKDTIFDPASTESLFGDKLSIQDLFFQIDEYLIGLGSGGTLAVFSRLFGGVFGFGLIAVLSFYLAAQQNGVARFLRIITTADYEDYVVSLWERSSRKIGQWMQGQLVLAGVMGVLIYVVLTIFKVEGALLFALFAGVCELIPVFGPVIAAIPGTMAAFGDGNTTSGLLVLGFYIVLHQFESNLFYPLVMKKVTGLSPVVVILALVVGAKLAGFIGMLLAIPLSTVLVEFLDDLSEKKKMKDA